jgi:hypothetical protein
MFLEDNAIFGEDVKKRAGRGGAVVESAEAAPWTSDKEHPTLDLSKRSPEGNGPVSEYYEQKPWRRTYFVLNRKTGEEVTYDFDGDGRKDYAPLLFLGTHSGNRFPPVVGGDGLLYQTAGGVKGAGWISRGGIVRWKVDSPLIGVLTEDAHDEPQALAAGGGRSQGSARRRGGEDDPGRPPADGVAQPRT